MNNANTSPTTTPASPYRLHADYAPMGDQPEAIRQLVDGLPPTAVGPDADPGRSAQVLLGVTGSGKTFTMANVIQQSGRPTLILSHNKTLAAQLYGEMRSFFPENSVQYFVSYYDYYQPEAYMPSTDTYIEKDLAINQELDQLRLATAGALLSGRRDVIVVSSVSCLYGMGNPEDFYANIIRLKVGQPLDRDDLLRRLLAAQYTRNDVSPVRGSFQAKGETVDVFLVDTDLVVRVAFCFDEIEEIETLDPQTGHIIARHDEFVISPANIFMTTKESQLRAIDEITLDLGRQVEYFQSIGKEAEAARLKERVEYDIEMIKEVGYCSGIENYSRYFDGRPAGSRPCCLLDYFPPDFLLIVDESHVTVPQIHAMSGGDFRRKSTLVEYGFRLPAAIDNRPLKFEEFEALARNVIFVSATPADYEIERAEGIVAEQVIRPTGLLDPLIEVRPSNGQIDDLLEEIQRTIEAGERTLVTTLTKRQAEELDEYLREAGVRSSYIHSDVDTLDRVRIMDELRDGVYDVLVGVNLLREGLDLPEVSLVAILDADKEGFLRNERSLTQTIGRAARNVHGRAIMYADTITGSMRHTIDETERRRLKQMQYNTEHGITPRQVMKPRRSLLDNEQLTDTRAEFGQAIGAAPRRGEFAGRDDLLNRGAGIGRPATEAPAPVPYDLRPRPAQAATRVADASATDAPAVAPEAIEAEIARTKTAMLQAAKELNFLEAAQLRDYMLLLEERLKRLQGER